MKQQTKMSEHGGPYYQLFPGPSTTPYRQPNVLQSLPPASQPGNFVPFFPANYPRQRQVFAEYSLWGPPSDGNLLRDLIHPRPTSSVFNVRPPQRFPIQIHFERRKDPPMSPRMPPMQSMAMSSIPNQGMGNQGIGNQGMGNQGMGNQGIGNQTMGNQGMGNQGIGNQGMGLIPMPQSMLQSIPPPIPLPIPQSTPQLLTAAVSPMPMSPMPSLPDAVTQTEDQPVGGAEEPELTGLEEPEKMIIEKQELYKVPVGFNCCDDDDDEDENPDSIEQSSNSSGSTGGDWTHTNFQPAGTFPSVYPWASRPARVVNNRGRKANIMQRRLVRALSQPVRMEKGASMMQRMGWMGGGLGRDESGIVDPIAPNAVYAQTTVGFGQDTPTLPKKRASTSSYLVVRKKHKKQFFKTNVLLQILAFVKNDELLEIYFDCKLMSSERKRIHRLVSAVEGREEFDSLDADQLKIVSDINLRKRYSLATQSEGDGATRQICVYKSAADNMFLVTPDDCRPCIPEVKEIEEEPNPFLKSITNHIKEEEGTILKPQPPNLFDKLVEFFIDFCDEEVFTEFRFLGPFTKKEVNVINNFITLINDLSKKKRPFFKCPLELLNIFTKNYRYLADSDNNGFVSITKVQFDLRKEFNKEEAERKQKIIEYRRGNLQNPPYVEKKKK